jgi:hypothetical protein
VRDSQYVVSDELTVRFPAVGHARRAHKCCGSIDNEIGSDVPIETPLPADGAHALRFEISDHRERRYSW